MCEGCVPSVSYVSATPWCSFGHLPTKVCMYILMSAHHTLLLIGQRTKTCLSCRTIQ